MDKIDEKVVYTEAHHKICVAIETFARMAPAIPKISLITVQNIYGRFDDALYNIFKAENTFDIDLKKRCLHQAKDCIFFQFTGLELLVKNHSITVGQANEVIKSLRDSYTDITKWLNYVNKNR